MLAASSRAAFYFASRAEPRIRQLEAGTQERQVPPRDGPRLRKRTRRLEKKSRGEAAAVVHRTVYGAQPPEPAPPNACSRAARLQRARTGAAVARAPQPSSPLPRPPPQWSAAACSSGLMAAPGASVNRRLRGLVARARLLTLPPTATAGGAAPQSQIICSGCGTLLFYPQVCADARTRPAAPAAKGAGLTGAPTWQGASNVRCALVRVLRAVALAINLGVGPARYNGTR